MSFHGNNVDCILHIGTANYSTAAGGVDSLPAYGSDTFTEVGLTGKIQLPTYEISKASFSVLNDSAKRAVGGKLADQVLPFDIVLDDTDATHDSLFADMAVVGGNYRNYKVVTPTGEQHFFKGFLAKWTREGYDASGDAKEVHVECEIAISGAVTVV